MVCALGLLVGLVMIFVMPKIEDIFRDFGLRLPAATARLIGLSRGLYGSDVLPWVVLFALVMVLGGTFRRAFTTGREPGRFELLDRLLWYLPISHGLERDRGLADACRVMTDALATGRSLPRAIDEAAGLDVNAVLRGRLVRWGQGIQSGQAANEAARAARLPALVAGMIGSGRGPDPAGAVEFLAAYYAGRFSRAREFLSAAAGPIIVFVFGGIVLFIVAGMYQPLVSLMDALSGGLGVSQ
jgi:type IV pilus assembly protein PilC